MIIRPGSVMTVRPPSWISRRWARKSSIRRGPVATPSRENLVPKSAGGGGNGAVTVGARRNAGATVGGAFCA
jgi:hypothetical protein